MSKKQLAFSEDARMKMKKGIDTVAMAVSTTLGPKGRNVAIDKKWGAPTITHDGVTVAKEIELKDPYENMGAQLLKEAAIKTNEIAGDGTTTATVLAHALVNEGLKNTAAGANPMLLKRGLVDYHVREQCRRVQLSIAQVERRVDDPRRKCQQVSHARTLRPRPVVTRCRAYCDDPGCAVGWHPCRSRSPTRPAPCSNARAARCRSTSSVPPVEARWPRCRSTPM